MVFKIEDKRFAEGDGFHMTYKAKSDDGRKRLQRKSLKRWENLRNKVTRSCSNELLGSIFLSFFQYSSLEGM